jgi:hypothetical protein
MAFIKYWRSPCQAGQLIRHATAWTQYNIGTSTSFLKDVKTPLPHMEVKWLNSLRDYLKTVSGSIELDNDYVPQLERVRDCHIMDLVLESTQFSTKEVCMINYCRLYLQVVTISDITLPDGIFLDPTMLRGSSSRLSSRTTWHHFHQIKPSPKAWTCWRKANRIWSDTKGTLHEPLAQWIHEPKAQRREWQAYLDSSKTLYIRSAFSTPTTFHVYLQKDITTSIEYIYYATLEHDSTQTLPDDAYPIAVQDCRQGTWRVKSRHCGRLDKYRFTTAQTSNFDFNAYIAALEPWEVDLLQMFSLTTDVFTVLGKIQEGFMAACDGSVRHKTNASFGWMISTNDGERLAYAYGPARGCRPSSYRAEAYGLLSILCFITRIQRYCHAPPPLNWNWTVTSDNQSLIEVINDNSDDGRDTSDHRVTRLDPVACSAGRY